MDEAIKTKSLTIELNKEQMGFLLGIMDMLSSYVFQDEKLDFFTEVLENSFHKELYLGELRDYYINQESFHTYMAVGANAFKAGVLKDEYATLPKKN